MSQSYDILIIGGGPAGAAAAACVAANGRRTLLIDRDVADGHIGALARVGDFPGQDESIPGQELVARMHAQAKTSGADVISGAVVAIASDVRPFRVRTEDGQDFEADAVVVATGASVRTNYLEGERAFLERGVWYSIGPRARRFAGSDAAVVGKTRQASEEALLLAEHANRVHFIIPSSKLDIDDELLGQLQENERIDLHFSSSLKRIAGGDVVESIDFFAGGREVTMPVACVITHVYEYKPTTAFLEKTVELGTGGLIKVDESYMTSVDGIFACGDVLCGRPQYPAIAVAQGYMGAIGADRFLTACAEQAEQKSQQEPS